jgi:hypothetical protein
MKASARTCRRRASVKRNRQQRKPGLRVPVFFCGYVEVLRNLLAQNLFQGHLVRPRVDDIRDLPAAGHPRHFEIDPRAKDIRLTSEHATTPWARDQIFQVLPLTSADAFNYRASYWQLNRERLSITWSSNGLSGVEMMLTPTANGFEGTIESFWDFEPSTSDRRRAVLTRRPC